MSDQDAPARGSDESVAVTLVLVSGSGRSGTSTLAGSLKRLGMHIPQPEVAASETNPRGFYEPRWVMDFHKGHLRDLAVVNIDSRPLAVELLADLATTPLPREQLRAWLVTQLSHPWIVVKDPHAFWFADVWRDVCADLGVTLKWLTAVRHPAEVVGSRDLAYRQEQSDAVRRVKETSNVAGWVHAALLAELVGRRSGDLQGRAFIKYADLLADWRQALGQVEQQLGLDLDADFTDDVPHPVDGFIDPGMRSSQLTWDDLSTPDWLKQMAQEVWELLARLVDQPSDAEVAARLDEIHADYDQRYAEAVALTFDHTEAERTLAARRVRGRLNKRIARLRHQLVSAQGRLTRAQGQATRAQGRAGSPRELPGWMTRKVRALRR